MQLHFIRHAKPKKTKGILYGNLDFDIVKPYEAILPLVNKIVVGSECFTSTLKRTTQTLESIPNFQEIFSKRSSSNLLNEQNYGNLEGRSLVELSEQYPKQFGVSGYFSDHNFSPPNGESFQDVKNRLNTFLRSELNNKSPHVYLFTHRGIICAAYEILGGAGSKEADSKHIPYLSVHTFGI